MYSFGPGRLTPAVKAIMIANVASVRSDVLFAPALVVRLGLRPADLFGQFAVWQLVTYMFVHAGLSHIFFNMLTLYFVGVELERIWGTKYLTKFYFASGLGAGLARVLLGILPFPFANQFYYPSTVGASGAIYGLLMAFALYFPTRTFLVFFVFPVQARYFVMILARWPCSFHSAAVLVLRTRHTLVVLFGYLYLKGKRLNVVSEIQTAT